jgi:hypothetical protein
MHSLARFEELGLANVSKNGPGERQGMYQVLQSPRGRLAQWWSTSFTPKGLGVRVSYRPRFLGKRLSDEGRSYFWGRGFGLCSTSVLQNL